MFVIIYNLYIKFLAINLVIDLSLHRQLFRVYCYCIDLDHILALIIVNSSWRLLLATTMSAVCLHAIVNS